MAVTWRVHELTERRGWGARKLAEEAGLDVKTARNIIEGRATRVDLETISRLSEALAVPPGALWRRTGGRDHRDIWSTTAGAAGHAGKEEIEELLSGREDVTTNPGLERATRVP
jgi:DNA-binding Xre family transcriptional regulator